MEHKGEPKTNQNAVTSKTKNLNARTSQQAKRGRRRASAKQKREESKNSKADQTEGNTGENTNIDTSIQQPQQKRRQTPIRRRKPKELKAGQEEGGSSGSANIDALTQQPQQQRIQVPIRREKAKEPNVGQDEGSTSGSDNLSLEAQQPKHGKKRAAKTQAGSQANSSIKPDPVNYPELQQYKKRTVRTLPEKQRRLDSLARLLEGESICAAVCLINNEILVTCNTVHAFVGLPPNNKHTRFIKKMLNYFTKLPHKNIEQGASLNKTTQTSEEGKIETVLSFQAIAVSSSVSYSPKDLPSTLNKPIKYDNEAIKLLTKICQHKINSLLKGKVGVLQIPKTAIKTIVTYLLNEDRTTRNWLKEKRFDFSPFLWESNLSPNSFKANIERSERLVAIHFSFNQVWRLARDFKKVSEYFQNQTGIVDSRLIAIGKQEEHAEIRMINYLITTGQLQAHKIKLSEKERLNNKDKGKAVDIEESNHTIFIGISKLCCPYCAYYLDAVNASLTETKQPPAIAVQLEKDDVKLTSERDDLKKLAEDVLKEEQSANQETENASPEKENLDAEEKEQQSQGKGKEKDVQVPDHKLNISQLATYTGHHSILRKAWIEPNYFQCSTIDYWSSIQNKWSIQILNIKNRKEVNLIFEKIRNNFDKAALTETVKKADKNAKTGNQSMANDESESPYTTPLHSSPLRGKKGIDESYYDEKEMDEIDNLLLTSSKPIEDMKINTDKADDSKSQDDANQGKKYYNPY